MTDVLGVGALNVDMLFEVESLEIGGVRFVPGGELVAQEGRFDVVLRELGDKGRLLGRSGGGSAANCIFALMRMGFASAFLGTVGEDREGDILLRGMEGVDLGHVRRSGHTGRCVSLLADGERSLLVLPNANDMLRVAEEDLALANACKVVHLSSFAGRAALEQQIVLADRLVDDVILSFDPGERYARRGMEEMLPLLRRTDVLFITEREMAWLTGMGAKEGGRRLLDQGPDIVVCKLGSEGSMVITKEDWYRIDPVPVTVVDKTGAGDVYAAGFLVGIMKSWSLRRCGAFASLAAARSITGLGREAYPDRNLLLQFARTKDAVKVGRP